MSIEETRKQAFAVPIFSVGDLQRSLRFYTDVMQFEKSWEWGDPADFACVALGNAELFLCQHGQGQSGTWIYLFINGIDDYYRQIERRGADILSGPVDEPWGMREIKVRDPDGHILRVGTSLVRVE